MAQVVFNCQCDAFMAKGPAKRFPAGANVDGTTIDPNWLASATKAGFVSEVPPATPTPHEEQPGQ